jgi:peptide deformylase
VERPDIVRARWIDEHGKEQEGEFGGLMSVCLQHEIDHLNGVLFVDHLSRLKRDIIVRKVLKARKEREKAAIL